MSPSPSWRDRFIDLAAELCRARGEPPPPRPVDTGSALQLSLRVDGVDFDALHLDNGDETGDRCMLQCRFGPLPQCNQEAALRQALEMNLTLNRLQVGAFGLNEAADVLVFSTQQSLQDVDAAALLQGLREIAPLVNQWRQQHHPAMG